MVRAINLVFSNKCIFTEAISLSFSFFGQQYQILGNISCFSSKEKNKCNKL